MASPQSFERLDRERSRRQQLERGHWDQEEVILIREAHVSSKTAEEEKESLIKIKVMRILMRASHLK